MGSIQPRFKILIALVLCVVAFQNCSGSKDAFVPYNPATDAQK